MTSGMWRPGSGSRSGPEGCDTQRVLTRRRLLGMLANSVASVAGAPSVLAGTVSLMAGCAHTPARSVGGQVPLLENGTEHRERLASPREIGGAASLRAHAAAKGFLTGCAVIPALLDKDAAYTEAVREQANILVAENAMKWSSLRPSATSFRFDEADGLLGFAERNHMKLRGHNLCWHRQIPAWFTQTATPANARSLLQAHIETVVSRYAGRMHSWDVVNEAIEVKDGRPDGLRLSPWLKLVGDDYIEFAFRTARRADPQALLTYNDYGIESDAPGDAAKREAILLMLRRLRTRHVPIDAVGIQSHIAVGTAAGPNDPRTRYGAGLVQFIARLRELDLQVFVTEMDVNDRALPPTVTTRDEAIASCYGDYFKLVLGQVSVTAVLTWGITDRYTWLDHEDARADGVPERPLPLDANYKAKPAFFAIRKALDQRQGSRNAAGL